MTFEGFTVKLSVLLGAGNHERQPIGMGFHHDINRLGLRQTRYRLHQDLDHILHGIVIIVMQQNPIPRRDFSDR